MSKKKVITVNGDSSKWYDKVIFVVKKDKEKNYNNVDFVLEAENIISDYMLSSNMSFDRSIDSQKIYAKHTKKNIDGIDIFLYVSICVCVFVLFALFMQSFL